MLPPPGVHKDAPPTRYPQGCSPGPLPSIHRNAPHHVPTEVLPRAPPGIHRDAPSHQVSTGVLTPTRYPQGAHPPLGIHSGAPPTRCPQGCSPPPGTHMGAPPTRYLHGCSPHQVSTGCSPSPPPGTHRDAPSHQVPTWVLPPPGTHSDAPPHQVLTGCLAPGDISSGLLSLGLESQNKSSRTQQAVQ